MLLRSHVFAFGCTGLLLAASAAAAQGLPPAAPTAGPAAMPHSQQPEAPRKLSQMPPTPARIELSGGRLTIVAENASLNQILREIADDTGMKITGGVIEERVFGNYGPASVSTVLNQLLDGAGSNVVLVQGERNTPPELILTPRNGGVTPPSPMSEAYRLPERSPVRDPGPRIPPRAVAPAEVPAARLAPPAVPSSTPAAPAPGTTTQQSPNGVKTPEQIYEELLKLPQNQKPASGAPPK